jgi:hypothetical protein
MREKLSPDDLRHVVDMLDGFRSPPFPFRKLKEVIRSQELKGKEKDILERSQLNQTLERLKKEDQSLSTLWKDAKKQIRMFYPLHAELERAMRKYALAFFFLGPGIAGFLGLLVQADLALRLLLLFIVPFGFAGALFPFYRRTMRKVIKRLREQWKGERTVKQLVDQVAVHLAKTIKKQGLNPKDFSIESYFNDYVNLIVEKEIKDGFILIPRS